MNIKIKYFEGATKLQKIDKGSWIDVYAREDVFIPLHLDSKVPLGFAMELPENYEALLNVRSSTSDKWGVILLNELGVIDTSFNGDSDEWRMSLRCIKATCEQECTWNGKSIMIPGTLIKAGDKIGQFRIQECMPVINFVEVDHLGNPSRGGFGSTGPTKEF